MAACLVRWIGLLPGRESMWLFETVGQIQCVEGISLLVGLIYGAIRLRVCLRKLDKVVFIDIQVAGRIIIKWRWVYIVINDASNSISSAVAIVPYILINERLRTHRFRIERLLCWMLWYEFGRLFHDWVFSAGTGQIFDPTFLHHILALHNLLAITQP